MRIQLIRHGLTVGNLERRYIGSTDEPLCPEGVKRLQQRKADGCYVRPQILCASPLLRCQQTCAILFPEHVPVLQPDLRETDFGVFEGKNYEQLREISAYQRWLDSGCTGQIPQGESRAVFQQRCCTAFLALLEQFAEAEQLTLVVHGGVIMALLEQFALPKQDFYQYRLENGAAHFYQWDGQWPVALHKQQK